MRRPEKRTFLGDRVSDILVKSENEQPLQQQQAQQQETTKEGRTVVSGLRAMVLLPLKYVSHVQNYIGV